MYNNILLPIDIGEKMKKLRGKHLKLQINVIVQLMYYMLKLVQTNV